MKAWVIGLAVLPSGLLAAEGTLTGEWGGARSRLEEAGVNLRGHYVSEVAYNPRGGRVQAASDAQQIDMGADLDLERLAGFPGGRLKLTVTGREGRSLSAEALGDNRFAVQEVFGGGRNVRLVEMHYQQELLDERLLFDVGWAPLGSTFATSRVYCGFQSLATCGTLQLDNFNWQNWPFGQWGASVRYQAGPEYYVSTGVYQANPGHATRGFDLSFDGTGVIVPLEVGWLPNREMPGEYKMGGYYDSSQARWGAYALATQEVYQGLTLFGMITASNSDARNFRYYYAGALYQGARWRREGDYISVLFARGEFDNDPRTHESVLELDYSLALRPWLQVRPNVQYVSTPGGNSKTPNAFVVGLFVRATF